MTSMIHKSPEQRRHRRSRYVRAIKPITEKYGCTAMQAAGKVEEIERSNADLRRKLEDERNEVSRLKIILEDTEKEVKSLKLVIADLKK